MNLILFKKLKHEILGLLTYGIDFVNILIEAL